uniref:NADH-ubiquinone oxidoreductase chain 2 n=1 Tax=Mythicomyia sp. TaxID=2885616 RepID=A0A8K1NTA0_9MUSC|nr:NADH dehydrogenase subunit 2 [Mythicomyia sp.]
MYKHSSNPMFFSILMAGTLVSISSTSWFGAWMGLEINLLAFIPLMNDSSNLMTNEASIKYFLVQALASSVLIFSVIIMMMKFNFPQTPQSTPLLLDISVIFSLMMKSGVAPLHFWFPGVMEGMSWMNGLILMVWQKIAPLMLMSYLITPVIILIPIVLSILIGSLGGLNQTSLRKIMAFSSINHLGWMMTAMSYLDNLWLAYLSFYAIITTTITILFNSMKSYHINQLFTYKYSSASLKFCLFFNLLSLGGLPPFLGFLPKWMIIQPLANMSQVMLLSYITVMTLITLFFYMRITFSAFLLNYPTPLWISPLTYQNISSPWKTTMIFMAVAGLPLMCFLPLPT